MNRRDFLRKTITRVLPIIAGMSIIGKTAVALPLNQSGCNGQCKTMCSNSCNNTCRMMCHKDGCTNSCKEYCHFNCRATCSKSCKHSSNHGIDSLKYKPDTTIIKKQS